VQELEVRLIGVIVEQAVGKIVVGDNQYMRRDVERVCFPKTQGRGSRRVE
jgi:hypothetical protein